MFRLPAELAFAVRRLEAQIHQTLDVESDDSLDRSAAPEDLRGGRRLDRR